MLNTYRIGILGAGTWGIALARMLCNEGHEVEVWSAVESEIEYFLSNQRHPKLPDAELPREIKYTKELKFTILFPRIEEAVLCGIPQVFY